MYVEDIRNLKSIVQNNFNDTINYSNIELVLDSNIDATITTMCATRVSQS